MVYIGQQFRFSSSLTLINLLSLLLLLLCLHFSIVQGLKITLSEYRQEDSETKCKHGLISGDTIVFKAHVDYTEDPKMKYVHIYIQKKADLIPILYKVYNLQEDCQNLNDYDCKHLNTSLVDIKIQVEAEKDYSHARIHGTLFTSDSLVLNSDTQIFPHISVASDIRGRLIANGQEISTKSDSCDIIVNGTDVNIVYACESQVSPCLIEIFTNDSTEPVQGDGLAVYNTRDSSLRYLMVTIKYCACRLDRYVNTISCTIKKVQTTERGYSEQCSLTSQFNIFGILFVISLLLLIVSWLCLCCKSCNNTLFELIMDKSDSFPLFQKLLVNFLKLCKGQDASEKNKDSKQSHNGPLLDATELNNTTNGNMMSKCNHVEPEIPEQIERVEECLQHD